MGTEAEDRGKDDAPASAAEPHPKREAVPTMYRPVLLAAALLILGLLFQQLLTLLLAVLITVILAIPVSAIATLLERRRVPRPLGALAGLLIGFAVVGGVFALIIPQLIAQIQQFADSVPGTVDSISAGIANVTGGDPTVVGDSIQSWIQGFIDSPQRLIGPVASFGLNLAGALGAMLLILVTVFYTAARPAPLVSGALRLMPPARRERAHAVMNRLRTAWIGWMKGVLVDMAVSGVLLYVGLSLIGLDFALLFAAISALLVVIPYFGAVLGGIPPVLFALADSPTKALLVLVVYVIVQQVEGNLIIPLVMARTAKLHPALVAVGVVVVGQLFGYLGLFVAVPILSTLVILVQELWVKPLEQADPRTPPDLKLPEAGSPKAGYEEATRRASSTSERTPKPDAPLPT